MRDDTDGTNGGADGTAGPGGGADGAETGGGAAYPGAVELAAAYARARPRLIRLAYAVLGSHAEAEDVVSDCWLRLAEAHAREPVQDVDAWATVAVARRAVDTLRSARVRRETYVGPWLPEPLLGSAAAPADPADRVTLDESVSFALLVVLETLSPAERTAWVLHDLFGVEFTDVGRVVGRSTAAVRQLAARARKHIADGAPRIVVDAHEHEAAVAAFARAAGEGDLAALTAVLDPQVTLTSDGGGLVTAARKPVHGADRVGRFLLGTASRMDAGQRLVATTVNGAPGLVVLAAPPDSAPPHSVPSNAGSPDSVRPAVERRASEPASGRGGDGTAAAGPPGQRLIAAISLTFGDDHRIIRVDLVLTPDKLPTDVAALTEEGAEPQDGR
ncbi:RNA polymerase sigma factor SigJ [Actinacidiphila alni]|uniref:RNA polymerase sigma factor SigJ n=1 Tax=Actinacidiphila alni TaxID=380248 RepID=UPI003410C0FF